MTEQPAEPGTEQAWLGNERAEAYAAGEQLGRGIAARFASALAGALPPVHPAPAPAAPLQAYLPAGHRIRPDLAAAARYEIAQARIEELDRAAADIRAGVKPVRPEPSAFEFMDEAAVLELPVVPAEPDLWLDTEATTTRALQEIQNGNINSSIAYLQSALAFALNYRHSISTGVAGL